MKAGRITLRPQAEAEMDDQFAFLTLRNVDAGLRFLDQVRESLGRLQETPDLGIRCVSVHDRLTDILVWKVQGFPNHLIFYRCQQDAIEVVRILHRARDIEALFDSGGIP